MHITFTTVIWMALSGLGSYISYLNGRKEGEEKGMTAGLVVGEDVGFKSGYIQGWFNALDYERRGEKQP